MFIKNNHNWNELHLNETKNKDDQANSIANILIVISSWHFYDV